MKKKTGFPRSGFNKICEVCGKEFYVPPVRKNARFCGMKCKGIASRLPEKACEVCGKIFKPVMGRGNQPCCSLECGHKYRTKGKNHNCLQCNKSFYAPAGQEKRAKFCSVECANLWQGRNKIEYTCETCGHKFKKSASHEKHGNVRYCSPSCAYKNEDRKARLIAMNVKQQTTNPNKLEIAGYAMLDKMKIKYERQSLIAGKFCVDVLIESQKTIIQFDGDYWHANPERFPQPDKRQRKRIALDKSQDAYLRKMGYKIIRIWEHEIKENLDIVRVRLIGILKNKR